MLFLRMVDESVTYYPSLGQNSRNNRILWIAMGSLMKTDQWVCDYTFELSDKNDTLKSALIEKGLLRKKESLVTK